MTTDGEKKKKRTLSRTVTLPDRVKHLQVLSGLTVLELGCGVGLTGLVAALALDADISILTDLQVVIDRVTSPNVVHNTSQSTGGSRTINNGRGRVIAMPLCWGNEADEMSVLRILQDHNSKKTSSRRKKKKGRETTPPVRDKPDLVLIGDVAYQHRPGAPSHFEALLSTLLHVTDEQTLVLFATRVRMPASIDLLCMIREHFDDMVDPPLRADEVDSSSFANQKHNMTIHFLQRKAVR